MQGAVLREPPDLTLLSDEQIFELVNAGQELLTKRKAERQEKARKEAWQLLASAGLDREGKPLEKAKRGRKATPKNGAAN